MDPSELPAIVPIFPLAEPILLPGTVVPLQVSEPRDRVLIEDALEAGGYVGILQPRDEEPEGEEPELFTVGCLGQIGECSEDGAEYLALVEGVIRFRVCEELPAERGYRRARVDYGEFLEDPTQVEGEQLEFPELKEVVRQRIEANRSDMDLSIMDDMVGTEIVTALAHALPFSAAEKQALVETPSLLGLPEVLLQLMAVGPGIRPGFDHRPARPS